jgi:hypothetical protein
MPFGLNVADKSLPGIALAVELSDVLVVLTLASVVFADLVPPVVRSPEAGGRAVVLASMGVTLAAAGDESFVTEGLEPAAPRSPAEIGFAPGIIVSPGPTGLGAAAVASPAPSGLALPAVASLLNDGLAVPAFTSVAPGNRLVAGAASPATAGLGAESAGFKVFSMSPVALAVAVGSATRGVPASVLLAFGGNTSGIPLALSGSGAA